MYRLHDWSYARSTEHYRLISEFELENQFRPEIEDALSSVFILSQNFPARSVSDILSGENFSLTESYHELEISYELAKYGFHKQSIISLRVALDVGVFSIYWSILGKEDEKFRMWLSSRKNTPFMNDRFWKKMRSNSNIAQFDDRFQLVDEIKALGFSDFVHTKGVLFSNFGRSRREDRGQDKFQTFELWVREFKKVVRILITLHLLRFPLLNLRYSTDYLLSKFGTTGKIPQFGAGLGDEMRMVDSLIPDDKIRMIQRLSHEDQEVVEVIDWLNKLPDLSENELRREIMDEQKLHIEMYNGFNAWQKLVHLMDSRVDNDMVSELQDWAKQNNLMDSKFGTSP